MSPFGIYISACQLSRVDTPDAGDRGRADAHVGCDGAEGFTGGFTFENTAALFAVELEFGSADISASGFGDSAAFEGSLDDAFAFVLGERREQGEHPFSDGGREIEVGLVEDFDESAPFGDTGDDGEAIDHRTSCAVPFGDDQDVAGAEFGQDLFELGPVRKGLAGRLVGVDCIAGLVAERFELAAEVLLGCRDAGVSNDHETMMHLFALLCNRVMHRMFAGGFACCITDWLCNGAVCSTRNDFSKTLTTIFGWRAANGGRPGNPTRQRRAVR